jgi:hypothetical protein
MIRRILFSALLLSGLLTAAAAAWTSICTDGPCYTTCTVYDDNGKPFRV